MWVSSIKKRTSVRTYDERPLEKTLEKEIMDFLNNCNGPFDAKVRFYLLDFENSGNKKLGTYGVIRGAKSFILGMIKKQPRSLEQLGYILEKGMLYATSLGLGTCWLAGTFKRQEFLRSIDLEQDEELPVISPLGYPKDKRGMVDSFMRMAAGSNNRKDFKELFFTGNWENSLTTTDKNEYIQALEMVRLAPSASNKQPWRILVDNNKFHFYLARNKGYGDALGYDVQKIDIGIAMCHFELTMEELGFKGLWKDQNPNIDKEPYEYIITYIKE